jgi:hypothetical protein
MYKRPYAKIMRLCLKGKNICYPKVWLWPPFSPDLNPLDFFYLERFRDLGTGYHSKKIFAMLCAFICRLWAVLYEEFANNSCRLTAAA